MMFVFCYTTDKPFTGKPAAPPVELHQPGVNHCCSHCGVMCLFHVFCALLFVLSSFAVVLMGKRELVALLCLSSWCLVIVISLRLFLMMLWFCLQCVIEVFPDCTHLLTF